MNFMYHARINVSCCMSRRLLAKKCILSYLPLQRNLFTSVVANTQATSDELWGIICFDDIWRLFSPHSSCTVSRVHMPGSLWKLINTIRIVRVQLMRITSLSSVFRWLVAHIFKLNFMKGVGWTIRTIFTGTLVHHGSFSRCLTSNAHNLCKLTFHKTKII